MKINKLALFGLILTLLGSCDQIETLTNKQSTDSGASNELTTLPSAESVASPSATASELFSSPEPSVSPKPSVSPDSSASPSPSVSAVSESSEPSPSPSSAAVVVSTDIKGKVSSKGKVLNNALLTLEPGTLQTSSYNAGQYLLSNVPPGTYTLHVDKEGYESRHFKVSVNANEPTLMDADLWPALKSISSTPETPRVLIGQPLQMEAVVSFQDGSYSRQVKWQIQDASLAQINEKGEITGLKAGNTVLKVALVDSDVWQKEIPIEVVRYIFSVMGPNRMTRNGKIRLAADPPTDARFANAKYSWKADPEGIVKISFHPAAPNIAIVEALKSGEVTISAQLEKDDIKLSSKSISLSIED